MSAPRPLQLHVLHVDLPDCDASSVCYEAQPEDQQQAHAL